MRVDGTPAAADERVRVLLVDDQPAQLAGLEMVLGDLGLALVRATSGTEALELLARDSYALVLMDVAMPDLNGLETAARLRATLHGRLVPVIFLTASTAVGARLVHGYSVGGVDYLIKPVDPEVLRTKVMVFVELFRKTQELERQTRRLEQQAELLRRSDERHRAFAELVSDLRVTVELPEGGEPQTEVVGDAFLQSCGLSPADVAGPRWRELVHPEDAPALEEGVRRVLEGGRAAGEVSVALPDGRMLSVRLCAQPVTDAQGRVSRVYAAVQDVTTLRHLEERLRQRERVETLGKLAGGIAHDFNNLLTVINGNTELALAALPAEDPLHEPLSDVQDAGQQAARLAQQLLAFGRKAAERHSALDVNEVVGGVISLLMRLLGDRVDVACDLDPRPCVVVVDRSRIEQLVMNLALNARDAMPDGGRLAISTRLEADVVRLTVSDTGVGMDARTAARAFERFFTTKRHGHGLGLATVSDIVRQHNGTVSLQSVPGRGTTFFIQLPAAPHAPVAASSPAPAQQPACEGTLLLVSADRGVRRVARRSLERAGYRVLDAADGAEASRVAREHGGRIDGLVTDVAMPDLSGPELADALRAEHPGIGVLYLSSWGEEELARACLDPASIMHLSKPFTSAQLLACVARALPGASR